MESGGEGEVDIEETREQVAQVAQTRAVAPPGACLEGEEDAVFREPPEKRGRSARKLPPKLIGEGVERFAIALRERHRIRNREPGIEVRGHPDSEGENGGGGRIPQRPGGERRPASKSEYEVEDQAKVSEAMAHAMQAEKEELIRGRKKVDRGAMKFRGLGTLPDLVDAEIEDQRVLDVVVKIDCDVSPAPRLLVVNPTTCGREAENREQVLGSGEIGFSNKEIEV